MGEFYYRVTDNDMCGDRIFSGDTVLIRESRTYLPSDICAIANEHDISQLNFRRIDDRDNGYLLTASNIEIETEMRDTILVVGIIIMFYQNT
ncbi:S24 family peptidase [Paenibacillus sp. FSL F4-0236]|uniref:S24 family peptidase n=1 Tax=Paenibacillus sp. FSL F4-0236 TaxID=2954731 RepID=UPI0030F4E115